MFFIYLNYINVTYSFVICYVMILDNFRVNVQLSILHSWVLEVDGFELSTLKCKLSILKTELKTQSCHIHFEGKINLKILTSNDVRIQLIFLSKAIHLNKNNCFEVDFNLHWDNYLNYNIYIERKWTKTIQPFE